MTSNEIVAYLQRTLRTFQSRNWQPSDLRAMQAVVDYGRPYIGINRPKGYRKRRAKHCFLNPALLALTDRGTYVEGFASSPNVGIVHHAWISLDGAHAIDTTRDEPADCHYFGISFPNKIVARYAMLNDGYIVPLLAQGLPDGGILPVTSTAV